MKMMWLAPLLLVVSAHALADAPDGAKVYQKWCAPCHAPGITHAGTHALMAKYAGRKSGLITEWTDLTPDYVRVMVRTGISVMPQFRKTEISDAELESLARFLTVRPQEIK
jgi:(+)-pinoresinol hydroxylase